MTRQQKGVIREGTSARESCDIQPCTSWTNLFRRALDPNIPGSYTTSILSGVANHDFHVMHPAKIFLTVRMRRAPLFAPPHLTLRVRSGARGESLGAERPEPARNFADRFQTTPTIQQNFLPARVACRCGEERSPGLSLAARLSCGGDRVRRIGADKKGGVYQDERGANPRF